MRYKLSIWIGAAVMAVGCAKIIAIDREIQLPGEGKMSSSDTTAAPLIIVTQKESDEVQRMKRNDINEIENHQESTAEPSGSGEGTIGTDEGNELILGPEEDGQGSDDIGGNGNIDGDNATTDSNTENGQSNSEVTPEPNTTEVTPEPDEGEITPETDEPPLSRSEESSETVSDVVQTESGPVQGFYKHGSLEIRSYIDIPYGKFSDIFQPPVKPETWEAVHEVKEHEKRCPQIDEDDKFAGDTDCLTLSVFAPSNVENAAVLFHIYDGQFRTGSADPTIYGPDYLVTKGIILVLPNYRVGPLGFLCMNNDVAPGNAALKDLTLALNWTKQNIEHFGGNSERIVVSGYGMSGALAGYLALSSKSRNYISGVITESGSVLAPWAIDRNPTDTVTKLTNALEQNITSEINIELLVTSAKDIDFKPCIENDPDGFINETPWKILQDERANIDIPFLIGSANHAGLHEATQHTAESLSQLNNNFSNFLPNDLKFKNENDKSEVAEKVKKQYFDDKNINTDSIHDVSLCYTDAYYLGPVVRASRDLVQAGAKVYMYEFSFVGELNRESGALTTTVQGAVRGDIVGYTFVQDDDIPQECTDEEKMVTLLTDLWVTFIQNGKPTVDDVAWYELEKTAEANEQWLSIGMETQSQKGLHVDRLALWTQIYNEHYIERNLARELQSSLIIIATALVLLGLRKEM